MSAVNVPICAEHPHAFGAVKFNICEHEVFAVKKASTVDAEPSETGVVML